MADASWKTEIQRLWKELVPASGQAATVQGELVRAIERLNDECYRNGNMNWDDGHVMWCGYLREWLNDPRVFTAAEIGAIDKAIARIMDYENPDTSGDSSAGYIIAERVVEWCLANPEPMPREPNPDLHR